jgi:hypothetical protein
MEVGRCFSLAFDFLKNISAPLTYPNENDGTFTEFELLSSFSSRLHSPFSHGIMFQSNSPKEAPNKIFRAKSR